jgi:hypothetical protein
VRPRRGASRVAALLWASPISLLGALLAPFFARRSLRDGVLLCEGATWPRRLGYRYRATTLGHVVLCIDEMDAGIWSHELVHVRQTERWGALMPFAYGFASLYALARGGHLYRDNAFEVEARRLSGYS